MSKTGDKRRIDRSKIKELYERGLSTSEIAHEMGCDAEYLRRIITDEMDLEPPKTKQKALVNTTGGMTTDSIEAWSKQWDETRFTAKMLLRTNFNKTKVMEDYGRRIRKNGLV